MSGAISIRVNPSADERRRRLVAGVKATAEAIGITVTLRDGCPKHKGPVCFHGAKGDPQTAEAISQIVATVNNRNGGHFVPISHEQMKATGKVCARAQRT